MMIMISMIDDNDDYYCYPNCFGDVTELVSFDEDPSTRKIPVGGTS